MDLFAALNTATGKVTGHLFAPHRAADFPDFLDEIGRQTEPGLAAMSCPGTISASRAASSGAAASDRYLRGFP